MSIVHANDLVGPAEFGCAQAGCRVCQYSLICQHEGLIHFVLRRHVRGSLTYADLLHAGRIGVWPAVLHFDAERGVAFSTDAVVAIQRRMWQQPSDEPRRATSAAARKWADMTRVLIPTMERPAPRVLPDSPFHQLPTLSCADLAATRALAAAERRRLSQQFDQTFAGETVRPLLPLRLELPPTAPVVPTISGFLPTTFSRLKPGKAWTTLTWSYACSTSARGGPSRGNASPVTCRLPSTRSALAWPG